MNELQKEYYERQAKEQAEREAAEEARLKAFMEEERRKDAERKFIEEINKAEQEEKEKLAAEEAERKAEEEAAEIINRMKAKIHEDRMKEKEREAQNNQKEPEAGRQSEDAAEEKTANDPEKVTEQSGQEDQQATSQNDPHEIPIEMVDEKPKAAQEEAAESKPKTTDTVKEVVKPASDGAKKQGGPKFKKGGKKGKHQTSGRPKPVEEPEIIKDITDNETELKENVQSESKESVKAEEKNPQSADPKNAAAETPTQENTQTKVDHSESMESEPEVVNLEGTVEPAEEAMSDMETTNIPSDEASEDEGIHKMTPEDKAASDEAVKWKEAAEEAQDKYKRLLAEFENARAREAKEAAQKYDLGAKTVLEKLLPVVDNFERAIQTIPEEDKERAFEQGVDKIYKQMMTVLEDIGVQPMNAEGTEFNPDLHNAVMHIEDESLGENVVAEEMQKGYMYKDTVLRYSMVKVAN